MPARVASTPARARTSDETTMDNARVTGGAAPSWTVAVRSFVVEGVHEEDGAPVHPADVDHEDLD